MPTLVNNAEAGAEDVNVSTGNSGGDSGDAWDVVSVAGSGAITYDSEHVLGTRSYKVVGDASNNVLLTWSTSLGTVAEAWGRLYVYLTGTPAANDAVVYIRNGSSQVARVRITTAGKLDVTNAANTVVATSSANVSLNQWVAIEWHCNAAVAGTIEARLYNNPASGTPTETIGGAATLIANITQVGYGRVANSSPNTKWLDFLGASTTGWMGLPTATVRVGQITLTGAATSDARVRVAQITLTGNATSIAAVQVAGIWLSGRRPPDALEGATPIWFPSGGLFYPLYTYQVSGGQLS
jgi:hypothetical protein